MTRLPMRSRRRLQIVRDVAGGRSFVTLASVLPESVPDARVEGIRSAVLRETEKLDLDAMVKFIADTDVWSGLGKLVQSYGFGPIVPNTVVLGHPDTENLTAFAALVRQLSEDRRNLVIADGEDDVPPSGVIDIWWRGRHSNGALMLALAFLLQRADFWRKYLLRVNMIVTDRETTQADDKLAEFLAHARVNAETRIIESASPFTQVIAAHSSDAALTFVGLRRPAEGERDADYGTYFQSLLESLDAVPFPVFVLANEEIEFHRIFT